MMYGSHDIYCVIIPGTAPVFNGLPSWEETEQILRFLHYKFKVFLELT